MAVEKLKTHTTAQRRATGDQRQAGFIHLFGGDLHRGAAIGQSIGDFLMFELLDNAGRIPFGQL